LEQIIYAYWRVPPKEARVLLRVLQHSPCSRASTLRTHLTLTEAVFSTLQGQRETDTAHTFAKILTPQFVMSMVADLYAARELSGDERTSIEEAVLSCVSAEGAWKAV
jgi:hypothetical protein